MICGKFETKEKQPKEKVKRRDSFFLLLLSKVPHKTPRLYFIHLHT